MVYTVFRWLFFVFNLPLFPTLSLKEVASISYGGFWFDWSIILYLNLPVIFLHVIPFDLLQFKWVRWFAKAWFLLANGIAFSILSADLVFYSFNGKRMDIEVLGLLSSLPTMAGQFVVDYWYTFLLFGALCYGLIFIIKLGKRKRQKLGVVKALLVFLVAIAMVVVGMRGGVSNKNPISPVEASGFSKTCNISLVTNSAFTFFFSLVHSDLEVPSFFNNEGLKYRFPVEHKYFGKKSISKKNIVLIIMESFSQKYVGTITGQESLTPHFDSLLKTGSYCTNSWANGRRSSQGLVALTSGIPALMNEPFLYSQYSGNKIMGLPKLLSEDGYSTAFFNGSAKDILGWRQFVNHVGFENYYSLEDYPNKEHSDGHWGIYDHYMFDYFESIMDTTSRPFFYTLFSISAHHPYNVPNVWSGDTVKDENLAIKAVRYSDWSLGRFFERIKDKPWFNNTIFVVTADHTLNGEAFTDSENKEANNWYQNRVGLYAVPVFFKHPNQTTQQVIKKSVSHVDVSASILKWSGYTGDVITWGTPIDELGENNLALHYVNGIYQAVGNNLVLLFDGENAMGLYAYRTDPKLENNLLGLKEFEGQSEEMLKTLKAAIQQHHQRVKFNQLFVKR